RAWGESLSSGPVAPGLEVLPAGVFRGQQLLDLLQPPAVLADGRYAPAMIIRLAHACRELRLLPFERLYFIRKRSQLPYFIVRKLGARLGGRAPRCASGRTVSRRRGARLARAGSPLRRRT